MTKQIKEIQEHKSGLLNPTVVARDKVIANRINSTLQTEDLGLLMMGVAHNVGKYLPKDIAVEIPPIVEDFYKTYVEEATTQGFGKWRKV